MNPHLLSAAQCIQHQLEQHGVIAPIAACLDAAAQLLMCADSPSDPAEAPRVSVDSVVWSPAQHCKEAA